jgi:hypothetical protein
LKKILIPESTEKERKKERVKNMVHAEASTFQKNISKQEAYAQVLQQVSALIEGQRNWVSFLILILVLVVYSLFIYLFIYFGFFCSVFSYLRGSSYGKKSNLGCWLACSFVCFVLVLVALVVPCCRN